MRRVSECFAAGAVLLLLPACTSDGTWSVRPVASGFVEGERSASFRVAEARAHFALSNIALAAEGFRRALREDPSSVDALNGLAACFDRMGRFDLARTYYEKALALAPHDPRLYANLATSLDLQGKPAEAAAIRTEASTRFAASALPLAPVAAQPVQAAAVAPAAAVTVPLTEAKVRPAMPDQPRQVAMAEDRPSSGPRLERTGLAEVTLRTAGQVSWKSLRKARTLPTLAAGERTSPPSGAAVVVLNGTSQAGLAARTRSRLQSLGWDQVVIGNTARPLRGSQILYPASRAREAQQLARKLGFPMRQRVWASDRLVVQLGRDMARGRRPA